MKAILLNEHGTVRNFILSEIPEPKVCSGHVVIKVSASSLNPVDCKIRNGMLAAIGPELPGVLHGDVAGVVTDVGNGVEGFKVGDEVGGHVVSGHVSTTAELVRLRKEGNDRVLTFAIAPRWQNYIFHKGYVALDGASLTVSGVDREAGTFSVSLIPETIDRTTLGSIQVGGLVNVEVDSQSQAIVDTVERVLAEREHPLNAAY